MRRLRAMGIRDKPIAPGSPWQNCFAERLIGSILLESQEPQICHADSGGVWRVAAGEKRWRSSRRREGHPIGVFVLARSDIRNKGTASTVRKPVLSCASVHVYSVSAKTSRT